MSSMHTNAKDTNRNITQTIESKKNLSLLKNSSVPQNSTTLGKSLSRARKQQKHSKIKTTKKTTDKKNK